MTILAKFGNQQSMDLSLLTLTFLDLLVALAIICAAFATDWYIERGPRADESTRAIMQKRRKEWMQVLAQRSLRMYDANLLSGLQSNAAFFTSTCLVALGGTFAILGQADRLVLVADALPIPHASEPATIRLRLFLPVVFLTYAFLKFAWSTRLFGYCAVLMGAIPEWGTAPEDEIYAASHRAGQLNGLAARSFAGGLRGVYFALATLAWLIHPLAMVLATLGVMRMIHRREFRSESRAAMLGDGQS